MVPRPCADMVFGDVMPSVPLKNSKTRYIVGIKKIVPVFRCTGHCSHCAVETTQVKLELICVRITTDLTKRKYGECSNECLYIRGYIVAMMRITVGEFA